MTAASLGGEPDDRGRGARCAGPGAGGRTPVNARRVRWPVLSALAALAALAALSALVACRDSPTAATGSSGPADLSVAWRTASPQSQAIDAAALSAAVAHARTLPRLTSLLVVRHGRLVAEEYFQRQPRR